MKKIISLILGIMILSLIGIAFASAAEVNVCCEKTKAGAWCQNDKQANCDTGNGLRTAPTSCDATSFCKAGCCYDSTEGICMESTPQKVCQSSGGVWADSKQCDIPQCQLGCCVLGKQAAFTTLVRCKKLAGFYGLQTDFRKTIQSETECIDIAQSEDEGACVFEVDFGRTCKLTTRAGCKTNSLVTNGTITNSSVKFYKNWLCSNDELGTNCGPSKTTGCVDGKNEVYFFDSCGNPANIYDASKVNDKLYWKQIFTKEESCGKGKSNANSASCGSCDYFSGSLCQKYDKNKDKKPSYGNFVCRDLNCKTVSTGGSKRNGESWCYSDDEISNGKEAKGESSVGSRYYRHICMAGEEIVEPCGDYRQQQCIEDFINTQGYQFSQAACRVNMWQGCYSITDKKDCENKDKGDCYWVEDVVLSSRFSVSNANTNSTATAVNVTGACLPTIQPGLKHWEAGEAQGICAQANSQCIVTYQKGAIAAIFGSDSEGTCKENCECLSQSWAKEKNKLCVALGDCGAKLNYIGVEGYREGYRITTANSTGSGTGLFGLNQDLFLSRFGN